MAQHMVCSHLHRGRDTRRLQRYGKLGANHGAFVYGHIGEDLITLASMLRIPVSLHNIADERLFRPHAWSCFGTKDYEGADYRACAAYGSLY